MVKLELLTNSLAVEALRTSKDVEAGNVVPPKFGSFWSLGTNAIVVDLADEKHKTPTALWNVVALNPERHTVLLALLLRRLSDDRNGVWIVLLLAEQQLVRVEPVHTKWSVIKLDKNHALAAAKNFKETAVHRDGWTTGDVRRDWNDGFHGLREGSA